MNISLTSGDRISIFEGITYTKKENNTITLGKRTNFLGEILSFGASKTFERNILNYSITSKPSKIIINIGSTILKVGNAIGSGSHNWQDSHNFNSWNELPQKYYFLKIYQDDF